MRNRSGPESADVSDRSTLLGTAQTQTQTQTRTRTQTRTQTQTRTRTQTQKQPTTLSCAGAASPHSFSPSLRNRQKKGNMRIISCPKKEALLIKVFGVSDTTQQTHHSLTHT